MTTVLARFDRQLGRITMYRLVLVILAALVGYALVLSAFGVLDASVFTFGGILASLAVVLVATVGSTWAAAAVLKVTPHPESAVITALILWFLFWPGLTIGFLLPIALAGLFAGLSKFVLAWRGRHVFNPAAIGAVLVTWINQGAPTWWVGTGALFPAVLLGGLLVLWRTRRLGSIACYLVPALVLTIAAYVSNGVPFGQAVTTALFSSQILFLAGFMLSEPLTQAPRAWQRSAVFALVAVLSLAPLFITDLYAVLGRFTLTPELAVVIGNLVAFALGQRRGLPLRLTGRREVTPGVHEFTFDGPRLSFVPGQYLELQVPHRSDGRGTRRVFSLVSTTDQQITIATRIPVRASTFKQNLLTLPIGTSVRATGVSGDFLLPADRKAKLVLIAGGIGVTPFVSQLRGDLAGRDLRVVYAVQAAADLAYLDDLAGVPGVVVCPDRPAVLPTGWEWVGSALLDAAALQQAVPDLKDRRAFISGPPVMVNAVSAHARAAGARQLHTDAFTGY